MPTARKEAAVQELRDRLAESQNLFLTDFQGLTVEEITKLRGELRKDGSTYAVVKNTLFKIAAGEDIAKQLDEFLAGPTGIVFAGADPVAPAKAIKQFADDSKKLGIKAAIVDGKFVDKSQIEALAALPPKIELIARLVGTLASPLRGLVTVLRAIRADSSVCLTRSASKKKPRRKFKEISVSWQLPNSSIKSINSPFSSSRISSSSSKRSMASARPLPR